MHDDIKKAIEGNKEFWDDIASVHYDSYNLEKLRNGGHVLDAVQVKELGDIKGKTVLHLMCHIGSDSLSLARLGAKVTAMDFSEESVRFANRLKYELKLDAKFIVSDIYDITNHIDEKFDIVYTSQGVLTWLKDIDEWGKIVSHFLKPGGFFYIQEIHPLMNIFANEMQDNKLDIIYSYFNSKTPLKWESDLPDYADENFVPEIPTYEWTWSIGDIVNALIKAGLKIEFLNEYDKIFYKKFTRMEQDKDGWWYIPAYAGKLPMVFTLKAKM